MEIFDSHGEKVRGWEVCNLPCANYPVKLKYPVPVKSESNLIRSALKRAEAEEGDRMQVEFLKRGASLTLQEYINGIVMMGTPAQEYLQGLEPSARGALCEKLGRLMAFDMLINNFDRFPLAWPNDGNLGNVMLGASQGSVVGIDQCVSLIKHPTGLQDYLGRVKRAVDEATKGAASRGRFQAVRDAINLNTGIELAEEEVAQMRSGVVSFMTELADMSASGALEKSLQSVSDELIAVTASLPARLDPMGSPGSPQLMVNEFCDLVRKAVAAGQEALSSSE